MSFFDRLQAKIQPDRGLLAHTLAKFRSGKTLVFTNGCFDLLHPGHVTYLSRARDLGDFLILGLNADASVFRLKGEGRPVHIWRDRALVLAGLGCVDFVTCFAEATPIETLEILKPDVHAKGGDYTVEQLPEKDTVAAYGGKIVLLPFLEGHSTTAILARGD